MGSVLDSPSSVHRVFETALGPSRPYRKPFKSKAACRSYLAVRIGKAGTLSKPHQRRGGEVPLPTVAQCATGSIGCILRICKPSTDQIRKMDFLLPATADRPPMPAPRAPHATVTPVAMAGAPAVAVAPPRATPAPIMPVTAPSAMTPSAAMAPTAMATPSAAVPPTAMTPPSAMTVSAMSAAPSATATDFFDSSYVGIDDPDRCGVRNRVRSWHAGGRCPRHQSSAADERHHRKCQDKLTLHVLLLNVSLHRVETQRRGRTFLNSVRLNRLTEPSLRRTFITRSASLEVATGSFTCIFCHERWI